MTLKRRVPRALALAAATLSLCLAASSAAATQPIRESFLTPPYSGPVLDVSGSPIRCGDDTVIAAGIIHGTVTTYYDATGDLVRTKIHGKVEETWSLASGSGKELRGKANYNVFTLQPGMEKWTGVFWHVIAPGVGSVLLDAGLEIIDWSNPEIVVVRHGKHQWLDGDFDALCAALQ
jgi:hypothetical protein